jgi:hypothetical protein
MWLASKPTHLSLECPLLWSNKNKLKMRVDCLQAISTVFQLQHQDVAPVAFIVCSKLKVFHKRRLFQILLFRIIQEKFNLASFVGSSGRPNPVSRLMIADTMTAMPSLFGSLISVGTDEMLTHLDQR